MRYNYYGTLFKDLKQCKKDRKYYYIKPDITVVRNNKLFYLLPTIMISPWVYRYPNSFVWEIRWLNVAIGIGLFLRKESENND